jgi:hypothetical protein
MQSGLMVLADNSGSTLHNTYPGQIIPRSWHFQSFFAGDDNSQEFSPYPLRQAFVTET